VKSFRLSMNRLTAACVLAGSALAATGGPTLRGDLHPARAGAPAVAATARSPVSVSPAGRLLPPTRIANDPVAPGAPRFASAQACQPPY
jgi:hypothetical protein